MLDGPKVSFPEFMNQINKIEKIYDREEDNFAALLCRLYKWNVVKRGTEPEYIYDRDIKKCLNHSLRNRKGQWEHFSEKKVE